MKEWDYENQQWTDLPAHLKHLPLFTRHFDLFSFFVKCIWWVILRGWFFNFYMSLSVKGGDLLKLTKSHPRLLLISNHGSHLDAITIAAAIPFRYWIHVFIAAAKDYFFSNALFTFFSQHCLGAIPFDRKDRKLEAVQLSIDLLSRLHKIWLIIFPEGTRSKDGKIHAFRQGVSVFAQKTNTPILFLFIEGNTDLWPKGAIFAKPGRVTLHVGPIQNPAPIDEVYANYRSWVMTFQPNAFADHQIKSNPKDDPFDESEQ